MTDSIQQTPQTANKLLQSNASLWARSSAFFEDGSHAGFYLITTQKEDDRSIFAAFSERSGLCASMSLMRNTSKHHAPYGREYLFCFQDEHDRTVYLEEVSA